MSGERKHPFGQTLPLFSHSSWRPLGSDSDSVLGRLTPTPSQLERLQAERPPSLPVTARPTPGRRLSPKSLPPNIEPWKAAALALAESFEELVQRGSATLAEQAAVARAYDAWRAVGLTEKQVAKVGHLVARAHRAIQEYVGPDLESAIRGCAGIVHGGLPTTIRHNMTLARVVDVVRTMRATEDMWTSVVNATAELIGWNDATRLHTAALLRILIDPNQHP